MTANEKFRAIIQELSDKAHKRFCDALDKNEEGDRSEEFYWDGYYDCSQSLLKIIDSMQQPEQEQVIFYGFSGSVGMQEELVSEDLKEEIQSFSHQIQEECRESNCQVDWDDMYKLLCDTANHFAEWQKQQMMKNAILYRINDMPGQPPIVLDHYRLYEQGIRGGDKVKLIIIKED